MVLLWSLLEVVEVSNLLGMGVNGLATGNVSVSGGNLSVTNGLILDQGIFMDDGSAASIWISKNVAEAQLDIRANATVEFVFDNAGISLVDFNGKALKLFRSDILQFLKTYFLPVEDHRGRGFFSITFC